MGRRFSRLVVDTSSTRRTPGVSLSMISQKLGTDLSGRPVSWHSPRMRYICVVVAEGMASTSTSACTRRATWAISSMPPRLGTPRMVMPRVCGLSSTTATGLNPPRRGDCMASMVRAPALPPPMITARRRGWRLPRRSDGPPTSR